MSPPIIDDVIGFKGEWFDERPQIIKHYVVKYFSKTHEVEMQDLKAHRTFLKRSKLPESILPGDFQLDNQVLIYGRLIKLTEYADPLTKSRLGPSTEKTLVFMKPSAYKNFGNILAKLEASNYSFMSVKTVGLFGNEALSVGDMLGVTADSLTDGLGVSCCLLVRGSTNGAADLLAEFGQGVVCNRNEKVVDYFFANKAATTATLDNCTLCLIKSHSVKAKNTGMILNSILEQGYEVSAIESYTLDRAIAEEFFGLYKGTVADYGHHIDELISGPVVAIEIRAEDAVNTFRKSAGPYDIEMAKELFPASIRARFGEDNVRNGVHCTDLETDGKSECSYFFDVLHED